MLLHIVRFGVALSLGLAWPASAVEYIVTFEGLWNASQVDTDFPGSAHFTELVGATHTPGSPLWQVDSVASPGVEAVAEIGNSGVLEIEVNGLISGGSADQFIEIDDINSFPSSNTISLQVSDSHPNLSLISMVAPSPDWFVGVSDLALQSGGQWIPELSVDLHPYDAGTEDGSAFSLNNDATVPPDDIALQIGSPFVGSPVIGRLHLTLVPLPGWTALIGVAGALLLARRRGLGNPSH